MKQKHAGWHWTGLESFRAGAEGHGCLLSILVPRLSFTLLTLLKAIRTQHGALIREHLVNLVCLVAHCVTPSVTSQGLRGP